MKQVFTFLLLLCLFGGAALAAVEVGNALCPVSGDEVSGQHFVEHEGKRYALCCAHCEKEFKKDPAKFIAKLESGGTEGHEGHHH